jgi:hypothetical protein
MTWTGTHNDQSATSQPGHVLRVKETGPGAWHWSAIAGDLRMGSDELGNPRQDKAKGEI